MTVYKLRSEMTQAEFIYWVAYYENKGEKEKAELDKARNSRYTR